MIINWMLYSMLVGVLLVVAGYAAEYAVRKLKLPTRWVWAVVIVLSTAFSAMMLVRPFVSAAPSTFAFQADSSVVMDVGTMPRRAIRSSGQQHVSRASTSTLQRSIQQLSSRATGVSLAIGVNNQAWKEFNIPLMVVCGVLALLGIVTLAATFARLSGVAYALENAVVEGVPVLVSRNIGPGLLGVFRYRVVLPRWVADLPSSDVRTILAHEQEHALASDPSLTMLALLLVALQPWNPALWMALSRLRLAVESDCDARVLGPDGDVHRYGHLLLSVYERSNSGFAPLTALVNGTSHLELRIRRMVERNTRSFSARTIGALAGALLLCGLAFTMQVTAQRGLATSRRDIAMADSGTAMAPMEEAMALADRASRRPGVANLGRRIMAMDSVKKSRSNTPQGSDRSPSRKAGPVPAAMETDFEPMAERELAELLGKFTVSAAQREVARQLLRESQRQQWELTGTGRQLSSKERRSYPPGMVLRDTLIALQQHRDKRIAELLPAADRPAFLKRADAILQEQFRYLRH